MTQYFAAVVVAGFIICLIALGIKPEYKDIESAFFVIGVSLAVIGICLAFVSTLK